MEIRIDQSWALIALLVTYSLYVQFTETYRELTTGAAVGLAIGAALLFFGSVLTHEMAHALMSLRRKIPVRGITLFIFGGATHAKVESRGPADEFLISVVGPLTSLGLGAIFAGVALAGRPLLPDPVTGAFGYLGFVNIVLAVFNLLPGFPLDGGRVLRSAVWRITNSLSRATRIASIAGQAMGYLLVTVGVILLIQGHLGQAIWLAFIGWFLTQAARSSYEELQVRRILEGVEAEDVMARDLVAIPADITLAEAVDRHFMRYDHGGFPVEDQGQTVGFISLRGVRKVPREEWGSRTVRESMGDLDDQVTVSPNMRMDRVLAKLQDGEINRVLVVEDGDVIGIITPTDVARWLQRWRVLQSKSLPGS
ncbi:MAG TPA: site-2 protease family protein [Actinomycetota bacterium]|nr:site-2 protease family protein [Actinomycetota bacterium]